MRAVINDEANGLVAVLDVKGGYNPDIIDDLKARVVAMHREALVNRYAVIDAAGVGEAEAVDDAD